MSVYCYRLDPTNGVYATAGVHSGTLAVSEPVSLTIDLIALLRYWYCAFPAHKLQTMDYAQVMPLVGRREELARMDRVLISIGSGPRAIELVGEPGIGKTRLLSEMTSRAARRGMLVFDSWAREHEQGVPFTVFADALGRHIATIGSERLAWLQEHDQLADLLSPTWITRPAGRDVPTSRRYLLYPQLREFLAYCAAPAGLLLALDDFHWADAASAELLAYLLNRPPDGPVLIAVAYRPRQLWPRLARALRETARLGNFDRIEIGPLTKQETGELLGETVNRAMRDVFHRISEGNPLYLMALRDMRFRPTVTGWTTAELQNAGVSDPVRAAFFSELELLPDEAKVVAKAAAVAGDLFDPQLVASIADLPQELTIAALDELHERDILRCGPRGKLCYRHPLLRQAVYEMAGGGWLDTAHARAAEFLKRRGASPVVRAYHVERAARTGDRAAVALLADAADRILAQAPATAAYWYEAALDLLEADAPSKDRSRLLVSLGHTLCLCGQFAQSRDALGKALALLPRGIGARTMCVALSATIERLLGQHREATALLQAELDEVTDLTGPAAIILMLELATHNFLRLEHHAQRDHAERAHGYALSLGSREYQASAAVLLALAYCGLEEVVRAFGFLAEAEAIIDGLTDLEISGYLQSFIGLSLAEIWLDRYGDAIRHLRRAVAIARGSGQEYTLSPLLTLLAEAYLCAGQLAQAADCVQDAIDAAWLTGNDHDRMLALAKSSEIGFWTGDFDFAIRTARSAAEIVISFTDWLAAAVQLASVRVLSGEQGADLWEFPESHGGIELTALNPVLRARFYSALVEAELQRGQMARATKWVACAKSAAAGLGLPGSTAHALLAESHVLLPSCPEAALDRAQAAIEHFSAIGARLNASRATLAAADALAALGRDRDAAKALRHAEEGFLASGAGDLFRRTRTTPPDRDGARADLDARPSDAAQQQIAKLSRRELQVAMLVAEGHSNRQIAHALSVTDKTVEAHVSHILGKLAAPSRAAIASIVTRATHRDSKLADPGVDVSRS